MYIPAGYFFRDDLDGGRLIKRAIQQAIACDKEVGCEKCGWTGIMEGDPTAPVDSIRREDVPCPECQEI